MNLIDRRAFVKLLSATTAPLWLPACGGGDDDPSPSLYLRLANADPPGFVGHLQNGFEGAYPPQITGQLPAGLHGTFYRNGPGVFSRGSERKGAITDGDGMIRMYRFDAGQVSY